MDIINSIIKLINTNNDPTIEKSEVQDFLKQNKTSSIFTEYFSTFDNDKDIESINALLEAIEAEKNN